MEPHGGVWRAGAGRASAAPLRASGHCVALAARSGSVRFTRGGSQAMRRFPRMLLLVGLVFGVGATATWAATPSSGTLTDLTTALSYVSGPFAQPNPTPVPVVDNGPTCDAAHACDHYTLHVALTPAYLAAHPGYVITVTLTWPIVVSPGEADFDLWVYDSHGN